MIEHDNIQIAEIESNYTSIYEVYIGEILIWPPIYNFKGTLGQATSLTPTIFATVQRDESNNFKAFIHKDIKELKLIRCHFKNITEIPDFTNVKDAEGIFNGNALENNATVSILKKIENTVENLKRAYNYTTSIDTELDLSSLYLKKVTTIEEMFESANLGKLIFPKFNDSILINITSAFYNSKLTEIDFNGFTAVGVKNLNNVFSGCITLKTIDLSTFNLKQCESFYYTFERCEDLTSIVPPQTPSDKVYTIENMFAGCLSLREIDLSKFISKNAVITNMNSTFENCPELKKIIMPQCFDSDHQIDISTTFETTSKLSEITGPFPTPKGSFRIKLSSEDVTSETLENIVEALERHKGTIDNPFTIYMSTYIADSKMTEEQKQRIKEANWKIEQI